MTALTSVTSLATNTVPRSRWRRSMSGDACTWYSDLVDDQGSRHRTEGEQVLPEDRVPHDRAGDGETDRRGIGGVAEPASEEDRVGDKRDESGKENSQPLGAEGGRRLPPAPPDQSETDRHGEVPVRAVQPEDRAVGPVRRRRQTGRTRAAVHQQVPRVRRSDSRDQDRLDEQRDDHPPAGHPLWPGDGEPEAHECRDQDARPRERQERGDPHRGLPRGCHHHGEGDRPPEAAGHHEGERHREGLVRSG